MTRVLVCGGRDFANELWLQRTLDNLHRTGPIECVINGGAQGADALGAKWAREQEVPCRTFRADWKAHGKAAGPIRNQQMLDEGKPTLVVAFPGGRGTADMVRRTKAARVDCIVLHRDAIADTHPKDGDVKQAPLVSGGGAESNRPDNGPQSPDNSKG